ncbi:MAG: deoxyribodipyrimidine photolyase [Gemmatimonadetes bacterium]|nr:deoxyribodipyrimidine photolyase [Gemmatimonadota bacterium]NNM05262.1 deoxyribodipyrimidine photolyase [Gemmatimonadota bacterium]
MNTVPDYRIRLGNKLPMNPEGDYVLYWMTAYRRLGWNFALQRSTEIARSLGKPLVILEILQVDYPYASPRLHAFILEGMAERSRALQGTPVVHYPFIEQEVGEGKGLLPELAGRSCCVVADDFPAFFLPRVVAAAGNRLKARLEIVDSNGLFPMAVADRTFNAAYHFRRFLQKNLPEYLVEAPEPDPLSHPLPSVDSALDPAVLRQWAPTSGPLLAGDLNALQALPLDVSVSKVRAEGGTSPARARLEGFLSNSLQRYHESGNSPDEDATSTLSPYLHFGNISSHQVFAEVAGQEGWTPLRLSDRADGARAGWWGMGPGAEAFLDQLVTWRELGFNMCSREKDYTEYGSLPDWARSTLEEHEGDPRSHLYTYDEFREARTHDPLWNAAQRQLLQEGMVHNYLRMLWGKKILEWTTSAREALEIMIDLNDRLALDGRDPNSYSGIFWCLGRYDRGWPERPVYGKVRSMSSERTRKKVTLEGYLARFGGDGPI